MRISDTFARALDLVWPRRCIFCQKNITEGSICADCAADLPLIGEKTKPEKLPFLDGATAAIVYEDRVREAVHRFKYGGQWQYAGTFGAMTAARLGGLELGEFDAVSFVPCRRTRERPYDQAELLAREAAERLGLPKPVKTLLRRPGNSRQASLDAAARAANVLGAFALRRGVSLAGKRVLLVDDVITTGATLSECARMLRMAGAAEVWGAAFARAEKTSPEDKKQVAK